MSFYTDTLGGYTMPLEEAHTGLIDGDEKACFDEHALEKPDAQFLAQQVQAYRVSQAASINDTRVRLLKWPPLDDPRADDAVAPLASNTAPSQTGGAPSTTGSTAPQKPNQGMANPK